MQINTLRLLVGLLASLFFSCVAQSYTFILNDQTPSPNGTGLPIKWPAGTVPFVLKLGTDKVLADGTNYNTSVQAAMQTWNAVLGDLKFTSTVASGAASVGSGNEIAFSTTVYGKDFDANTLAVTTVYYAGNTRTESDIILNSKYTWDSYRGNLIATYNVGPYDLRRIALHELGHSLGLDHPDEAGQNVVAVMNSHTSNLDAIATDDINGAQQLYGPLDKPANDNFANASPLTLTNNTVTSTGFTNLATKEFGEPNHANNPGGHSIWWKWTAPVGGGTVTLDTKGSYSDTTLAVYTGNAVNALTAIASNDDIQPGVVQASLLNFSATGGTTYFIAVDGFNAYSSGVTLHLSLSLGGSSLPVITSQPADTIANLTTNGTTTSPGSATFSVVATGATSYQWFYNRTAIPGATGATLQLNNVTADSVGSYYVAITNSIGTINSSSAALTVSIYQPPPIVPSTPPPSSGGGGGGGGAPSLLFYGALSLLSAVAWLRSKRR